MRCVPLYHDAVLTYMSMPGKITALVGSGKLARYTPRGQRPPKRRLYLAMQALADLQNPSSAVIMLSGRGFIESALSRWTLGGRIWGNSKRGLFLDRLDPPPSEIWEIRVTEPSVQARLFGRFAAPDTLVLTTFYTRTLLGKKGSAQWRHAMQECQSIWKDAFGSDEPFSGPTIHQYVTENCDDFPI